MDSRGDQRPFRVPAVLNTRSSSARTSNVKRRTETLRSLCQRYGVLKVREQSVGPWSPLRVCAVERRRFPVGASPTRQLLQPEATGAVMEVTKWLKTIVFSWLQRLCRGRRQYRILLHFSFWISAFGVAARIVAFLSICDRNDLRRSDRVLLD